MEMTSIEKAIRESGHYVTMPNGTAVVSNTFDMDFLIAKKFGGESGIKDTYERAFNSFKGDIEYLTAMVLSLNHQGHVCYDLGDREMAKVFFDLQFKLDNYILDGKGTSSNWEYKNFDKEEIRYYYAATD